MFSKLFIKSDFEILANFTGLNDKMKYFYLLGLWLFLLLFTACKEEDEPTLEAPDCGTSFCMRAYRMNKDYFADYEAQLMNYQLSDGYAVAIWRNTEIDPPATFVIKVGNFQRPVLDGPGIFRFDNYETAYLSAEIERDSMVRFLGYTGYIQVDSVSEDYFSGEFEVDAQVDTLNNYLIFKGKFEIQK
jgi:hypothetical protein